AGRRKRRGRSTGGPAPEKGRPPAGRAHPEAATTSPARGGPAATRPLETPAPPAAAAPPGSDPCSQDRRAPGGGRPTPPPHRRGEPCCPFLRADAAPPNPVQSPG